MPWGALLVQLLICLSLRMGFITAVLEISLAKFLQGKNSCREEIFFPLLTIDSSV